MKRLLRVLQGVSHRFIIAVLMEYIRSLNQFQITVQVKPTQRRLTHLLFDFLRSLPFVSFSITCTSWWSRHWCSTTSSTCCTSSSSITCSATPSRWWVHTATELVLNRFTAQTQAYCSMSPKTVLCESTPPIVLVQGPKVNFLAINVLGHQK